MSTRTSAEMMAAIAAYATAVSCGADAEAQRLKDVIAAKIENLYLWYPERPLTSGGICAAAQEITP